MISLVSIRYKVSPKIEAAGLGVEFVSVRLKIKFFAQECQIRKKCSIDRHLVYFLV